MKNYCVLGLIAWLIVGLGCQDFAPDDPRLPEVNLLRATWVGTDSVRLEGTVSHEGSPKLETVGFRYDTLAVPGETFPVELATLNEAGTFSVLLEVPFLDEEYAIQAFAATRRGQALSEVQTVQVPVLEANCAPPANQLGAYEKYELRTTGDNYYLTFFFEDGWAHFIFWGPPATGIYQTVASKLPNDGERKTVAGKYCESGCLRYLDGGTIYVSRTGIGYEVTVCEVPLKNVGSSQPPIVTSFRVRSE